MSDVVIRAEGLSKKYYYGGRGPYVAARDVLSSAFRWPLRVLGGQKSSRPNSGPSGDFWALDDVSFEIKRGDVVGVIGRNGSGKSTLLKVLSRITAPTRGQASIQGRVGALLEVGAGFHPELNGRENVYLNGAILGMSRQEIARKFDEIVAFAEVEKFIDTPVKYYSSGMYTRLAFSVAAHLETEILLVDEVLAVGDSRFQKKCLNLMGDLGAKGRTVIFVSHNMPLVTRLCQKAILLSQGRLIEFGASEKVALTYMQDGAVSSAVRRWDDPHTAPGNDFVRMREVRILDHRGEITQSIDINEPSYIEMIFDVAGGAEKTYAEYTLNNADGISLFMSRDISERWKNCDKAPGTYISRMTIPARLLAEGTFTVNCALVDLESGATHGYELDALAFQALEGDISQGVRGGFLGPWVGVMRPAMQWETRTITPSA